MAAGDGNEAAAIAAFAAHINNAGGSPDGTEPAGCNVHMAAAALLTRLLGVLPQRLQPQLLADVLQLEAAVRGECLIPVPCSDEARLSSE